MASNVLRGVNITSNIPMCTVYKLNTFINSVDCRGLGRKGLEIHYIWSSLINTYLRVVIWTFH